MPTERSAEEIVRAKWPDASIDWGGAGENEYAVVLCLGCRFDYPDTDDGVIGSGKDEDEAWADAAARIKASEEEGL